jgi:hypothetical protein
MVWSDVLLVVRAARFKFAHLSLGEVMKRSWILLLVCFSLVAIGGCSDSDELAVTADNDELKQWVSDNPAPPEIPLSGGDNE